MPTSETANGLPRWAMGTRQTSQDPQQLCETVSPGTPATAGAFLWSRPGTVAQHPQFGNPKRGGTHAWAQGSIGGDGGWGYCNHIAPPSTRGCYLGPELRLRRPALTSAFRRISQMCYKSVSGCAMTCART